MDRLKSFNVLDRHQNIHHSYLLEASAGTGKTFSIENIVVRLLIEGNTEKEEEPCTIDQILVVTFTRAATQELKRRIRQTILKTLQQLQDPSSVIPDYLQMICEHGEQAIKKAKNRLEQALFVFDQAQIFTIHGFCARMLKENGFEGDSGFHSETENLSPQVVLRLIRDFIRTEIRPEMISIAQLQIVLKKHQSNIDSFEQALYKAISNGAEIVPTPTFHDFFNDFQKIMRALKIQENWTSQKILDDVNTLAPFYKEICNRQGEISPTLLKQITQFACLFDQDNWSPKDLDLLIAGGMILLEIFDPSKQKAKSAALSSVNLLIPNLLEIMRKQLQPLILKARDPTGIFAWIASHCQQLLRRYSEEEEKFNPDDLLKAMLTSLQRDFFLKKLQAQYRAAIIDEFQDTDPVQWNIFKRLFLNTCSLYLVGDPKQSIYSFRQADIYTYLSAADAIGKEQQASLDTNYRSQPSLVKALNTLFASENTPDFIGLPRTEKAIPYREVSASSHIQDRLFSDALGSVHFFMATGEQGRSKSWPTTDFERQHFYPYISSEILKLVQQEGFRFNQCAVLVRGHYQASQLISYFKEWNIPAVAQKSANLADSTAYKAMQELLRAILDPSDLSTIKTALGGKLIGWTHEQLRQFHEQSQIESYLIQFYTLRKRFNQKGFPSFFQHLLQSSWYADGQSLLERLLAQTGGIDIYRDLQQIADILTEHQSATSSSPQALLLFLDSFPALKNNEDERLKVQQDPSLNGVQVLTLHMSKGLEFDVVFALGLANRTTDRDDLILVQGNECPQLIAPSYSDEKMTQLHRQESDAEKMRQLYVSMTRAKHRLYVPVAIAADHLPVPQGTASPMELFLARFNQPAVSETERYSRIESEEGLALKTFVDQSDASITYRDLNTQHLQLQPYQENHVSAMVPPAFVSIPGKSGFIYSFTSLAKNREESLPSATPPHDFQNPIKTVHTLPSGNVTGNLLHHILESIPFNLFKTMTSSSDCLSLIRPYLMNHPLQEWEQVIGQLIYNTLRTPLGIDQFSFRLCDIEMDHCFREMEFLYPIHSNQMQLPANADQNNNFLKGFIDLFFEHHGKYYLVDWKSHWLGGSAQDYNTEKLAEAMFADDYGLQATIYAESLQRYLALVEKRPFSECFGGGFYLFLRGVDPISRDPNGIYYWNQK